LPRNEFDEIDRINRDLDRAGVWRAVDMLESVRAADDAWRAASGLNEARRVAEQAGLGLNAARAATAAGGSAMRAAMEVKRTERALGGTRRAWEIAANLPGASELIRPLTNMSLNGISQAIKTAEQLSPMREDLARGRQALHAARVAGTQSSLLNLYETAGANFVGTHRQYEKLYNILEDARGQGLVGGQTQVRVLRRHRTRESVAWQNVMRAATRYGPVVVEPNTPPPAAPSPKRELTRDYTPNLQPLVIPETASKPSELDFELLWQYIMTMAQAFAQHNGTQVVVRFIGRNGEQIIINTVSSTASGILVYLIISHYLR
jgi:hypothetical protein